MRKVELTMKEEEKYKTIKKLVEINGNKQRAANRLRLSIRQIDRLIAGYKKFGKVYFIHGNRGRKPVHSLSPETKEYIEELYITKYFDCTYTQFTEYLEEREHICLSVAEVGQILRQRYILSPKSHKSTKRKAKQELIRQQEKSKKKKEIAKIQRTMVAMEEAHPRQPRCIYFGEEVQMDASIHRWFLDNLHHLQEKIIIRTKTVKNKKGPTTLESNGTIV